MVYKKIAKSLFLPTFPILFPGAFDTVPKGTFQNAGKKSKKAMRRVTPLTSPWLGFDEYFVISHYMYMYYIYITIYGVYRKIAKIALSYPRFQFSFQGAFDTVEVLRKPPAASTTPAAPPPALPLPVPSGDPKQTALVHARRRPRGPAFGFFIRSCPYELP